MLQEEEKIRFVSLATVVKHRKTSVRIQGDRVVVIYHYGMKWN